MEFEKKTSLHDHFLVKKALCAVRKAESGKKLRCPLSLHDLNFILTNLYQLRWPMYTQVLFRVMLSTSFHGFLRPGEMVKSHNSLKFKDLRMKKKAFRLKFRKFKHHRGEPVKVLVKGTGAHQCPRVLMFEYLQLRGNYSGNLFVHPDGSEVTYSWYSKLFKQVVKFFSLDSGRWHSNAHNLYIEVPVLSL